ncbi:tetratricopeptide repeat protein [Terasakiella sp. SH-1]|uniref:tetratricopeptide repeat protein n=1 Tax=Terasakiella sp. SH-1 TaxID=2560057 RepID=UPI001073E8F3|nr:tetratricopeptide repeat protein [Terasakiella sp. SH-1]
MKRTLYLLALGLTILTVVGYVIGKNWEEEAQKAQAELGRTEQIKLWRKQARQGDAEAQYQLGIYYQNARADYLTAQKWFRVAASKGRHAGAQYKLAQLYMNGQGVENDLPAAMSWFRKSAAQGDVRAQYFLGIAYRDGWERKDNYIEAYKWFLLSNRKAALVRAEDPRFDPTVALAEMDAVMSRFDREQARKRVARWKAR